MINKYASTTTLNAIRAASPCEDGWTELLAHLGKTRADDEPLELLTVLESNGLNDALWVLSYAMPDNRLARHFQAWGAEQVLHIFEAERPNDRRVREQIAMLRNDDATPIAIPAAKAAAWAAARATARDAARAAARAAAGVTARAAAFEAARAASDAAQTMTAWDAAIDAQEKQLRKMIGETE